MTLLEALLADQLKGDDTPELRKDYVAWLLQGDEKSYNYYYRDASEGQLPVVRLCHFAISTYFYSCCHCRRDFSNLISSQRLSPPILHPSRLFPFVIGLQIIPLAPLCFHCRWLVMSSRELSQCELMSTHAYRLNVHFSIGSMVPKMFRTVRQGISPRPTGVITLNVMGVMISRSRGHLTS